MTFPNTPLDFSLDLLLNGAFASQASYIRNSAGGLTITRGKRDESSPVQFGTCTGTLKNIDGRYNQTNPTSAIYGQVGRNTQTRAWVRRPTSVLYLPDWSTATALASTSIGAKVSCPDSAGLSITGDLELQFDGWLPDWTVTADLMGKYTSAGVQESYVLSVASGYVTLTWSTDGSTLTHATSTIPIPVPQVGRKAIKATLDVSFGFPAAAQVIFYTSDSIGGTWTQLGSAVLMGSTTSIFDSTASLVIGGAAGFVGKVYAAKVLSGIGGTAKANPDFTAQADGAATFADAAGNTWTLANSAALTTKDYRFHGEATDWVRQRDQSGKDITSVMTASGILRRLGQGKSLKSPIRRALEDIGANLVGYWPMEDAGETMFGASVGRPAAILGAALLATSSIFVASAPLPTLESSSVRAEVASPSTGATQVRFLSYIPAGATSGLTLARVSYNGGSVDHVDLVYTSTAGGTLTLTAYDSVGTSLSVSSDVGFTAAERWISIELANSGADVSMQLNSFDVTTSTAYFAGSSPALTSKTIGRISQIVLNPNRSAMTGWVVGHVSAETALTSPWNLANPITGYAGERAGDRVARLCLENGVSCLVMGASSGSTQMGAQEIDTLLNILRSCERTDAGLLFESREFLGLIYRTGSSLYSQSATVTLSYSAADLSKITPASGDIYTANDVTATRPSGSFARWEVTTGSMSTQAPPNGVGTYDIPLSVNPMTDDQLLDMASWRAHLGTDPGDRMSELQVNLARSNFTTAATLAAGAVAADLGDRVDVGGFAVTEYPDGLTQLVIGSTEVLNNFTRTISFACGVQAPYRVGVYDSTTARYDLDGTVTSGTLTTTATSVGITNASAGCYWSHADGDFDGVIDGEVVTVTGIAGTGASQTLTVVRSVNGVIKTHAAGAAFSLALPVYYGM